MDSMAEASDRIATGLEKIFTHYFCIFCEDTFSNINDAYVHYKNHMSLGTFCRICDGNMSKKSKSMEVCEIDHETEEIMEKIESEKAISEMWIERLLTYQEELMDKPHTSVVGANKFYLGCPVCDHLTKACSVQVPTDVAQRRKALLESAASSPHPATDFIRNTGSPGSAGKDPLRCHAVRHACGHLRYYPFECLACEKLGRYQKKPDVGEMVRHIQENHHLLPDGRPRKSFESIIKCVAITKVEQFMDYYISTNPMVRFDPLLPESPSTALAKVLLVDPLKISRNPQTGDRQVTKVTPSNSSLTMDVKPASITILTNSSNACVQPPKTTYHSTSGSGTQTQTQTSDALVVKSTSQRIPARPNSQAAVVTVAVDEKPVVANIIVKNKNHLMGNNSSVEQSQSTFQQQFGNIFDDEDMIKFPFNTEEDVNVEYFCIFCDSLFKDKDLARRHYQKHVNYYPMMCSLCGEGATDMQEFLKHHTEVHPNSDKGRYKRREQPAVDKWINGFLYAQATVIKAFPAREQCPVCEKVFSADQIQSARPRRSTINRKIDHVHRHLCYLPYECVKCKEEGKEFLVAYFESKAHSHIKLKHPQIDDTESRWFVFQKTVSIPKLDEYIRAFLTKQGISMEYERRPMKKQFRETFSSPDFLSAYNNSWSYLDYDPSDTEASGPSNSGSRVAILQSPTRNEAHSSSKSENDGIIILDNDREDSNSPQPRVNQLDDPDAMVVAVSPSHTDYLKVGDCISDSDYFCIFCSIKFPTKIDAYPHYGEHLDYKPVVCLICENKFPDIEQFTVHHQLHHQETTDLMYEIREDQNVEKWVDEFLDSQQSSEIHDQTLTCSCAACCPVCDRIRGNAPLAQCTRHNDVDFSDHIHLHLLYYTYECSLCKKFGRTTRVPNLDAIALTHVREQHMIREASTYQLGRTFPKTLAIPQLERFIAESVQKKRTLDRKWKIVRMDTGSAVACTIGTNGLLRTEHANGNSAYRATITQAHLSLKGVAHVRVEGGRVVNLPSSVSIRSIQQKQMGKTLELTRNAFKVESGLDEGLCGAPNQRFYVKCLHCNKELPSRKQLKLHHKQEHPGLSMACFTTPKSMLSLGSS